MNNITKYILQSKYNFTNLQNYPKIISMNLNIVLYYKQKHKYFLFINIILLLIFFNINTKTRFLFKSTQINILQLSIKSDKLISKFLVNFLNIYFPLIDSFSAEFKFFSQKNIFKFSFFKFPLIFELNSLFTSLEHLYNFLNNYKFQLQFNLVKQKNFLLNYNYLHILKLPILLK